MAKKKPAQVPAQPAVQPAAVPAPEGQTQEQAPVAPVGTDEPAVNPTPAVAAPTKEPKPAKIEQNGVTRPGADTTTGKVWAIADSISAQIKAPATRADVMKQANSLGINPATTATQYGKWRKFNGLKSEPKAPKPVAAPTVAAPVAEPVVAQPVVPAPPGQVG